MRTGLARRSISALALVFAALSARLTAQDTPPVQRGAQGAPRARVAVVLSSGGPRGLAHVGVLQALEELRVPVDLVVGSEWGALVGGLYSAGFDPAAIQAALISTEWVDALADRTPRKYLSLRSKNEDRDFMVDIPLGLGGRGLILPPGILVGTRMRMELGRLTMRSLGCERFDDLPVPFRAVATDLDLGGSVTLQDGSLAKAIEASLSTPVLMQPVDWNGCRLIGGALADPLPVGVALALGAEFVIAVDVVEPDTDRAQLTFLGVGARALNLVARKSEGESRAKLRPTDLLCTPMPDKADLADFERAPAVVECGRAAALAMTERLAPLALDPEDFEAHVEQRRARVRELPVIDSVRVRADCPLGQASVQARMDNVEGERFDPEVAGFDLARLYGLKLFRRVDFDLAPTSEDHADLWVGAEPTPTAPLHWRAGLTGEVNAGDAVNFVMGASMRYAPTDDWGSEWRAKVEVGNRALAALEHRQALDPAGRWYLRPHTSWQRYPVRVESGGEPVAEFNVQELTVGVDLLREIGDTWETRAGVVYRTGQSRLEIGDPTVNGGDDFDEGGGVLGIGCDSFDDLAFPSSGWLMNAEWFLPVDAFHEGQDETVRFRVDRAMEVGPGALTLGGELDTVVGDVNNVQSFFPLGGFLRLSGLAAEEISGPTAVLGRAVYTQPFSERGLERKLLTWYWGGSLETGNVFDEFGDIEWDDLRPSGSVFVGVDTLLGPVYVGYGLTDGGSQSAFLVLGRLF